MAWTLILIAILSLVFVLAAIAAFKLKNLFAILFIQFAATFAATYGYSKATLAYTNQIDALSICIGAALFATAYMAAMRLILGPLEFDLA